VSFRGQSIITGTVSPNEKGQTIELDRRKDCPRNLAPVPRDLWGGAAIKEYAVGGKQRGTIIEFRARWLTALVSATCG
jgi:hypothetical protein